jgi:hypothetical protein
MRVKEMRTILVLPETALGRTVATMEARGLTVAVAPRPLLGRETWTGEFTHGSLYAAGDPALCAKSWTQDDAFVVTLASRAEMDDVLRVVEPRFDDLMARYDEIGMDGRRQVEQAHGDAVWFVTR